MDGCRLPTSMANPTREQNRLLSGTLDMLVLQALRLGPQHGYGIGQSIRSGSGDVLQVETGSLYPALHRLEKQGWIKSEWRVSQNNQRAKYYRLTPSGKKQLLSERNRWNQMIEAIASLLNPAENEG